ncbi:hypothetical protein Sjap_001617 [Stephania japonica]|uniref:Dof zinc finger protein n=1 Tax=Stephania japonica TaxID=461633 RepID=A0AAP0KKA5_9MAGN
MATQSIQEKKSLVRPQPDQLLKCPRCESTNTKFCYYNNYSLSQPRYFCKACRRYWTKGGSLRNVPVGGGCRKNKRPSKKSSTSCTNQGLQVIDNNLSNLTLISSFSPFLTYNPNNLSMAFDRGALEKQSTKLYLGLDHDFSTDHNSVLMGNIGSIDQSNSTAFLDSYRSTSFHEGPISDNLHSFYGGFGEMENEDGGDNCDGDVVMTCDDEMRVAMTDHEESTNKPMFNYEIGSDHGEINRNVCWNFPLQLGGEGRDHQCWNDRFIGSSWQGHC